MVWKSWPMEEKHMIWKLLPMEEKRMVWKLFVVGKDAHCLGVLADARKKVTDCQICQKRIVSEAGPCMEKKRASCPRMVPFLISSFRLFRPLEQIREYAPSISST